MKMVVNNDKPIYTLSCWNCGTVFKSDEYEEKFDLVKDICPNCKTNVFLNREQCVKQQVLDYSLFDKEN